MATKSTSIENAASAVQAAPPVRTYLLRDTGVIPNSRLPLLVYPRAFALPEDDPASWVEQVFQSHGWGGAWRNGIYPYHHYHSTAHEVLGVYCGWATVQFGGEPGIVQRVEAGDGVMIPAGVAHKNLDASPGFAIVGAYPDGQKWDLCYGRMRERPAADHRIAQVPLPKADPIYGRPSPLRELWRAL
jgi:uncharacterized protein YjlB